MKNEILKYLKYLERDNKTSEDFAINVILSKIELFVKLLAEPNIEKMIADIDSKIEKTMKKKENCESSNYIMGLISYIDGLNDAKEIINSNKNTENGELINKILEINK